MDGPDGFQYYFYDIRKEKNVLSYRHSTETGVIIWGAISHNAPVYLKILKRIQNVRRNRQLLANVKLIIEGIFGEEE